MLLIQQQQQQLNEMRKLDDGFGFVSFFNIRGY